MKLNTDQRSQESEVRMKMRHLTQSTPHLVSGPNATLNGWSLNITAVPEPVNVALAVFGVVVVGVGVVRHRRAKAS